MTLKMKLFLLMTILATSVLANGDKAPNVIHITVDDLGVMDVGFMGDRRYSTANIDKLASTGIVFTNAYAPAANCAPSRACVLTGQYPTRHGVYTVGDSRRGAAYQRKLIPVRNTAYVEDDNLLLTEAFKKAGYLVGHIGKWHIGKSPETQGVDVNIGGSSWGQPQSYFSPYKNPALSDGPDGEYLTDRLTTEAINFVKRSKDKKFFLHLAYYTVHSPWRGRKDLRAKYKDRQGVQADYAAMVECLDENVGRLMKSLDELALTDTTLLVFTSDNGGIRKISPQDPLRAGKGSYYEGGTRVPLAIRWPQKIKPGTRSTYPVTGLDFYPTYLELCEIKLPAKVLDGASLAPILAGRELPVRPLFWHFPIYLQAYSRANDDGRDPLFRTRPGSTIRWGKWKLHEYFEDGGLELYDLENDPGERQNLVATYPMQAAQLHKRLRQWRAQFKAVVPLKLNPAYDPEAVAEELKRKAR